MASSEVRIYEVGPRDGLQAERAIVGTDDKLRFIELLSDAGLREIETTSFVSPTAIPQLADAEAVLNRLARRPAVRYPVLVPNQRGMDRALSAGADAICVFTAATESYAQHNINMSIAGSIEAFGPVVGEARKRGFWTRAYVSTAFGCPYEGEVSERAVIDVSESLLALGVDELAISDTLGVAGPTDVRRVLGALAGAGIAADAIGLHFHDTRGTALVNVITAMELGYRSFDASAGGTGGSPFAPGSAGNLATEDLVYLLDREGVRHGADLDRVIGAARFMAERLGHPVRSHLGQVGGWPGSVP
jgi:hydroxymethylglutaryl-CoA lyase